MQYANKRTNRLWTFLTMASLSLLLGVGCGPSDPPDLEDTGGGGTDTGTMDTGTQDTQDPCEKTTFYEDSDGDMFGNPDVTKEACEKPAGYVENSDDCNDSDGSINPDASEKCDGVDNNCDGTKDPSSCDCTDGETQECGTSTGACEKGTQTCSDGSWGSCEGGVEKSTEVCDGKDNDCDGDTDEKSAEDAKTFYRDNDGDNYGNPNQSQKGCSAPAGYVENDQDCDDTDPKINPDASEKCDGVDNNCDGTTDPDSCSCTAGETQKCGNGTGICTKGTQTCKEDGTWGSCSGGTQPGTETCNGKDDDCDGMVDENLTQNCAKQVGVCSGATVSCQNGSYPSCGAAQYGNNYESGDETMCDNKDNDCDGNIDEGVTKKCPKQTNLCQGATTSCSSGSYAECGTSQYGSDYQEDEGLSDGKDNDCDGVVDNYIRVEQFGDSDDEFVDDISLEASSGDLYFVVKDGNGADTESWDRDFNENWSNSLVSSGWPGGVTHYSGGVYAGGQYTATINDPNEFDLEQIDFQGSNNWDENLSAQGATFVRDVAVNPNTGAVYAVGWSKGEIAAKTNNGGKDVLLLKYDSAGNNKWVRQIGGSAKDVAHGVAVDPSSGDVYIGGSSKSDTGDFSNVSNSGPISAFLMKYNSAGTQQWLEILGPSQDTSGIRGVAYDANNDMVYVSGDTAAKFGGQSFNGGNFDGFVARHKPDGSRDWVRLFGTSSSEIRFFADVDESSGAVYVAGRSEGDFGGNTNNGGLDIAYAKYDKNGNQKWARLKGTSSDEVAIDVAADETTDDFYLVGWSKGYLQFIGSNQGKRDAYIWRLKD